MRILSDAKAVVVYAVRYRGLVIFSKKAGTVGCILGIAPPSV